jgi:hypothetical protein
MNYFKKWQKFFFAIISIIIVVFTISQASPIAPGTIRYYSTIRSIGIEWDISGDTNHNAKCDVFYRRVGEDTWKKFIRLFRVDFQGYYGSDKADRRYNMLAGSIMFLDSSTNYEVKLSLTDIDGGSKDTILAIATRHVPVFPSGGRIIHVSPGTGSGDGSVTNPYKSLSAAQTATLAGDIILIHAGNYGNFNFNKSGSPGAYIVWKAAGDGDVILNSGRIAGNYIWLHGINFINNMAQTYALVGQTGSTCNVITRCNFKGFNYSITLQNGSDDWYIADNTIVGDKTNVRISGDFEGEGIELGHTNGHTICHNTISQVADGISYMGRNCDIYANDIFDVVDDGIEPDYGYSNIRIWQNRITNPRNHAFSFQPMFCGPWYFIRNQVMGIGCYMLKYRVVDRFFLAHNTFVGWNTLNIYDQNILNSTSRNNLWIQAGGSGYIWEAMPCSDSGSCTRPERWTADWRTDVDYDGFDEGNSNPIFKWFNPVQRFSTLTSFVSAVGIETHSIVVRKEELFDSLFAFDTDSLYSRHYLTLKQASVAIDKGEVLPGINEDYSGNAPDLGAYEFNSHLPWYGVRPSSGEPVILNSLKSKLENDMMLFLCHNKQDYIEIWYSLPGNGNVDIVIFNIIGKQVAKFCEQSNEKKMNMVLLKSRIPGVYFFKVKQGDAKYFKKKFF